MHCAFIINAGNALDMTFPVALVPGWRGGVFQRPRSHCPWSGGYSCPDPTHVACASHDHLPANGKKPESAGVWVCGMDGGILLEYEVPV